MSKKRLAIKNVPVSVVVVDVVVVVVGVVVSVDDTPGVVGTVEGGIVGGSVAIACSVSKIIASYARNTIARGFTRFLK